MWLKFPYVKDISGPIMISSMTPEEVDVYKKFIETYPEEYFGPQIKKILLQL
jgi:hypothetical protein